jgi:hypothetical protein
LVRPCTKASPAPSALSARMGLARASWPPSGC